MMYCSENKDPGGGQREKGGRRDQSCIHKANISATFKISLSKVPQNEDSVAERFM
jgi:hypothetical protein